MTFDSIMTACPFETSTHGVKVMLKSDFQRARKYGGKDTGKQATDLETFSRRIYIHPFFNQMHQGEDKAASTETSYCMRTFMLFSPTLRRIYKVQIRKGWKNIYNDPAETATPATDTDADYIFASFGKV